MHIFSGGSCDIEAVYQVARPDEADKLNDTDLDNHRLLWHGSRTSNLISIFSRGLLIAPKDAPTTGYMFGKVSSSRSSTYPVFILYCYGVP